MRTFVFECRTVIDRPLSDVFPFFADARNLERITPPWLRFEVLTPAPIPMDAGTLIDYRLRWHGLPLRWRTEIAAWAPPHFFIDRQLRGPYRLWVHEHHFSDSDGRTLMLDRVRYAVFGGRLIRNLIVGRDVEAIFAFRQQRIQAIFGSAAASSAP